jgi:hypothetical protein
MKVQTDRIRPQIGNQPGLLDVANPADFDPPETVDSRCE